MAAPTDPLEVLLELTRLLASEGTLEDALQATTDAARALLPCDHASLRLFDDSQGELLASARSGAGRDSVPVRFHRGEGVLGIVADTGKSALVADTELDERFTKGLETGFAVRSLVAVPLVSGGRVVGVLSASAPAPRSFSERDRDLAQLLANCCAPAIETARLARLAVTDDLTRAYNTRHMQSRLPDEVERARRYGHGFAVAMLDLDHFKRVNDAHGHAVGDEVLRGFVERVRGEVRLTDVLFRRGGEEFLLLMPATGADEAMRVAERIRARVAAQPIPVNDLRVPLTVSIGVATWNGAEDARAIQARADAALYRAKEAGRDRVLSGDEAPQQ